MNYPPQSLAAFEVGAFVLAGGASSRMGRDKALLPIGAKFLLAHLVGLLDSFAPQVFVVAPSGRYEKLGFHVIEDQRLNCGPLAGIETALSITSLEWNLILACVSQITGSSSNRLTAITRHRKTTKTEDRTNQRYKYSPLLYQKSNSQCVEARANSAGFFLSVNHVTYSLAYVTHPVPRAPSLHPSNSVILKT